MANATPVGYLNGGTRGVPMRLVFGRALLLGLVAIGFLLQVGDAFSGAAAYILMLGQGELNPIIPMLVSFGGIAALFWAKAVLLAIVAALLAVLPARYAVLIAAVLAISGAYGLHSNVENLGQQIDLAYWLDLLHSTSWQSLMH
jgi:hypothetical protein